MFLGFMYGDFDDFWRPYWIFMLIQLSNHNNNHSSRFPVHQNLGIEPTFVSLAQVLT